MPSGFQSHTVPLSSLSLFRHSVQVHSSETQISQLMSSILEVCLWGDAHTQGIPSKLNTIAAVMTKSLK